MSKGDRYLRLFNSGLTYAQIAARESTAKRVITRNDVAKVIYDHRQALGLPVRDVKRSKGRKRGNKTAISAADKKMREGRLEQLKECVRDENGVLVCPPRHASGYGFDTKGVV